VDVVIGYSGRVLSRRLRFQAASGSVVGIIGDNGVGKSALLKTVAGVIPSLAGVIRLDGVDLTKWPTHRRARMGRLRYLPQRQRVLGSLTVRENLHLAMLAAVRGRRQRDAAIQSLLSEHPFSALAPFLERPAAMLSGGQAVLLGLAGVLAADARVLLLDEPMSGLSANSQRVVAEALRRLTPERIIIIAEQHVRLLFEFVDTVYVLRRESAEADHSVLFRLDEVHRALIQQLYLGDRVSDAERILREAMVTQ